MSVRDRRKTWLVNSVIAAGVVIAASTDPTLFAQRDNGPVPATQNSGQTPEQQPIATFEASNVQQVRSQVGKNVIVIGEVDRIGKSASGNRFINLKGNPELSAFIPGTDIRSFGDQSPEQRYQGQTIAVSGKIERFKDQLQIRVTRPEQISIRPKTPTTPVPTARPTGAAGEGVTTGKTTALPEPVELKDDGRNAWISPAGVRYSGFDPEGRTRKDHVLRHAVDDPDRDGPHGVFDGGKEHAFAWIDLAWQKIKQDRIVPESDGNRDTYIVKMGRRVGYLGGQTGKRRGNPALNQIFIVVRKDSSEVITAFPR